MKKLTLRLLAVSVALLMVTSTVATTYGCKLDGLSPGFWKHHVRVYLGYPGRYSVPHNDPRITDGILDGYLATIGVSAQVAYDALSARGPGMAAIRLEMANNFNAAAGYGEY